MKSKKKVVSIITINYNGMRDTCELIDSLAENEVYPYEVIVVDNASRNDEASKLQKRYVDIRVVSSPVNLGFAGGNNLGYSFVESDYVLFLNNDIIITEPFLQKMIDRLESGHIGLVSPKLKYEEDRNRIQFAGFTPLSSITLRNRIIGTGEIDLGQYDTAMPTPYVHGAAMMGKKEVIDHVGLMTDIYFLFYEELDWSVQFRKAGYTLWYEPAAFIFHKEGMSASPGSPLRIFYLTRARLLFARRNIEGLGKVLSCIYLSTISLMKNTIHCIFHAKWDLLFAFWRGTKHGLLDSIS